MKLNLLVIRTENPEKLKEQYETLGLSFLHHRHGNGPFHFSSEVDGLVFEIYPTKKPENVDRNTRLGFEITDFDRIEKSIRTNWSIVSEVKISEWGKTMILQDLDGRKVEIRLI